MTDAELILARTRLAVLLTVIGVTPTGERYYPTWFSTDLVCDALDRQIAHLKGKSWGIRRVLVQQPTQTGKSYHTSCGYAAAIAGRAPSARQVITGYGGDFMTRTLPDVRTIMGSGGYREVFPHVRAGGLPSGKERGSDNTQKIDFFSERLGSWHRAGSAIARSMAGAIGGNPMDVGIIEDPYKDWGDALSAAVNRQRRDFYTGVFKHRQQSRRSVMTVAFTPFTPTDLGYFVQDQWEREGEPYLILKFPMFQRPDSDAEIKRWNASPAARAGLARFLGVDEQALAAAVAEHGLRPYDRRPHDYPLLPFRDRDREFYEQIRRSSPARDFAALCQLDPEAGLFEQFPRTAWRFYDPRTLRLRQVVASLDPNAKETDDGSFAAIGVYNLEPVGVDEEGRLADPEGHHSDPDGSMIKPLLRGRPALPFKVYRLDESRARPRYGDLLHMVGRVLEKWPEIRHLIIEDKAAGQSLAGDYRFLNLLDDRGVRLVKVNPRGSKSERTAQAEPAQRNGYCLIPSEPYGRFTNDWLHDRTEDAASIESGEGIGFLSEMAGGQLWDDRRDEFSQLISCLQDPQSLQDFNAWDALAAFV